MYLLTYDISEPSRLRKVAKICEKYLYRVQKSVFEGELTESQIFALKKDLKKAINKEYDTILIYFMRRSSLRKKIRLGKKTEDTFVII